MAKKRKKKTKKRNPTDVNLLARAQLKTFFIRQFKLYQYRPIGSGLSALGAVMDIFGISQSEKQYVRYTHPCSAKQIIAAVPVDRKPVSERRPGEGMLAEEVFNARPSLAARYAEAALMCAVLEDAVDCFQKQFSRATRRAKHLGREAEQWLFSDDPNWPFSFLSICSVLDLCPEYIRQGLKRWHGGGVPESPYQDRTIG